MWVDGIALAKWLREETRVHEVMGSNPSTVDWMRFFTFYCCKKCSFEKTENKQKGGR